jgi:O-antigen/teichoic acid export membrane protein
LTRETARLNAGAIDALALRRLLRALEGVFFGIAVLGAGLLAVSASLVARRWLNVEHLPLAEVEHAIQLMAALVALRWVCGLYRGAINGFERMVWLGAFNSAAATARFVLVIPYFMLAGTSPSKFFLYQLMVAAIELGLLITRTYQLLPTSGTRAIRPWHWRPIYSVLRFSLGIAFSGSIWVLVTQVDKLLLSKLLPLADYAFFTLAVLLASSVSLVTGPVSVALLPRLTGLAANNDRVAVLELYRNATQLVTTIALPLALVLGLFAEPILWAWTGDPIAARTAAPVLMLYAFGNGVLAISALAYYLQFAMGDIRLHLIGHLLFALLLIPALILATLQWGMIGAGWAWLSANVAYLIFWVPLIHRRLTPGLHLGWLLHDVGEPAVLGCAGALIARAVFVLPQQRLTAAISIAAIGMGLFLLSACGSAWLRKRLQLRLHGHRRIPKGA